jgi:hypothetical protein
MRFSKNPPAIRATPRCLEATVANDAFSGEWKGMVRMAKSWNRTKDKPVKPSFLIEVMARGAAPRRMLEPDAAPCSSPQSDGDRHEQADVPFALPQIQCAHFDQ